MNFIHTVTSTVEVLKEGLFCQWRSLVLVFHHTLISCSPWCNIHLPVLIWAEGNIAISTPKETNINALLQRKCHTRELNATDLHHLPTAQSVTSCATVMYKKFSLRWASYKSRTQQVHILVQGWDGNITRKIYDSYIKKTRTCPLNECFHRWKWTIPPSFLPRHQSEVTHITRAVHELLLWLMRSIHRWFWLDSTLKLTSWLWQSLNNWQEDWE